MAPAPPHRMAGDPRLASLIREHKDATLDRWKQLVRARPIARPLSEPCLIDSIPGLLDRLADAVREGSDLPAAETERHAREHAQERLELGYELGQLIGEYSDLRTALFQVLRDVSSDVSVAAWETLNGIIDTTMGRVMERYSRAREKKLQLLEQISSEPLAAKSVEELLRRLLDVMVQVTPEVDTVTILLREGESLQVRASFGFEDEIHRSFVIAVGDGFAGTIAATRKPLLVHDAARDPVVKSDVVRERLRAIYGVPLIDAQGNLLGVAHMGSRTAYDFQPEDLILFRALANRATTLIESREASDRLLANEQQREGFIAILGHDLRTPLNAVVGSAQVLLAHGKLEEEDRAIVNRIARAGGRMSRLVTDILDFARARLGSGIPLNPVRVNLDDIVRTCAEELRLEHPGRTVNVTATIRSPVCCDPDRVAQIVTNLVGNALRHGLGGPVEVRVDETKSDALISVHNDGPPIPAKLLPNLFQPFHHGDGLPQSLGLGLFITQAITVAHVGSIEVKSEEGQGTTFVVRLPKVREGSTGT